jgi:hypothetical protein
MLGLHNVFADNVAFLQAFGCKFSVPSRWRSCTGSEVLLALAIAGIVASIGTYHIGMIFASGYSAYLFSGYAGVLAALALVHAATRKRFSLHVHHYCWTALALPALAFDTTVSAGAAGFFLGMTVDGIACWGMDPILVPLRADPATTDLPTVVWTRLLGVIQHPARWHAVLQEMHCVLAQLEPMVVEWAAGQRPVRDFLASVHFEGLTRAAAIAQDVRLLDLDVDAAAGLDGAGGRRCRPSAQADALVAYFAQRRGHRAGGDALPLTCGLVGTLHLGLFAGAPECRRQCELHLPVNATHTFTFQPRYPSPRHSVDKGQHLAADPECFWRHQLLDREACARAAGALPAAAFPAYSEAQRLIVAWVFDLMRGG